MTIVMSESRKKQIEDFHVLAHAVYPKAFARPNGIGHVPLKIGIVDDLRNAFPTIEKKVVEMFMDFYTSSQEYQKACAVAGAARVGLTGEIRGRVTDAQAASAGRSLSRVKSNPSTSAAGKVCAKTGKVGYRTGGEALESARHARLEDAERREIDTYRCSFCDHFHWGHKKPWSYVPRAMRAEVAQVERHVV